MVILLSRTITEVQDLMLRLLIANVLLLSLICTSNDIGRLKTWRFGIDKILENQI